MVTGERTMSVTALTRYIKRLFDKDRSLRDVWVRGELSNFKHHSRGHMYFTVKDTNSRISSVMFASQNRMLKFLPENGMKVLIRGEVSVYSPFGQYQLYAKEMQPDGIGNLYLAYEELKKKLEQEGLFSSDYKQELPSFPMEIGVITSPTGAAVRDIFTTIKRRFPRARITLLPVVVQGNAAAPSVAQALQKANSLGFLDVVIIGRGGGSIEELWAFNEETVARQIFASKLPVISAVGHETDYTISDFTADVRAATPTGAGELVVPHIGELSEKMTERERRLQRAMRERLAVEREKIKTLNNSYAFRYPGQLIRQKEQELDRIIERLNRETARYLRSGRRNLEQVDKALKRNHPETMIQNGEEKRQRLSKSLRREMDALYKKKEMWFQQTISKMNVLSPLHVMERGFGLMYRDDGSLVKSVHQVQPSDLLEVKLKDGRLDCQVWGIEEEQSNK